MNRGTIAQQVLGRRLAIKIGNGPVASAFTNPGCRFSALIVLLLAMVVVCPAGSWAQGSVPLATEVMIEDTLSNNMIVEALFYPVYSGVLSYNTVMASDGMSYSYSTVAGSMLNGVPISLTGGGMITSSGPDYEVWQTQEEGDYNGVPYWQVTDQETVITIPNEGYVIVSDYNYYDPSGNKLGDLHITVVVNATITSDIDTGYFTDKNGVKIPNSDFVSTSSLNPNGDWEIEVWRVYPSYPFLSIGSIGFSPQTGGAGNFAVTFNSYIFGRP